MPRRELTPLTGPQRDLVAAHQFLALKLARARARQWPEHRDDLVGAAYHGLCAAARRFDASRGITFGVFARAGIRLFLKEELRRATVPLGYRRRKTTYTRACFAGPTPRVRICDWVPEPPRPGVLPREPSPSLPQVTYL